MKLIKLELNKIIINPNRYRKDMGNIEELAKSIEINGLLTPIVVDEQNRLIAGERRCKAHQFLGLEYIDAIIKDSTDIQKRIWEIIENTDRKAFTWQEQVLATKELHQMLSAQGGFKWSERKTAETSGISVGGVCTDLNLAEVLEEAPDVFEGCKSKEQALKALKKYKLDEAKAELALRKSKTNYGLRAANHVFHGDCLSLIDKLPDDSINAIISDPIYGFNVFDKRFVNKNVTQPDTYEDSYEAFQTYVIGGIRKAARVLKKDSAIALFCCFQNTQELLNVCTEIGFTMDVIPAVWVRNLNTGRTNQPTKYFNRSYDLFVYGLRGDATLIRQGVSNVFSCPAIASSDREHQAEKPVSLMEDIISTLCLPGHTILDFMCGSGTTLVAAIKRNCIPFGFEILEKNYHTSIRRVAEAMKLKDGGMVEEIK